MIEQIELSIFVGLRALGEHATWSASLITFMGEYLPYFLIAGLFIYELRAHTGELARIIFYSSSCGNRLRFFRIH